MPPRLKRKLQNQLRHTNKPSSVFPAKSPAIKPPHLFSVRKGDRLRISKTGSPNAYFNVWAPKDDEAVFNGSAQGDKFDGIATQSGKYKVQVYMMRAQARRNTTAHYAVNVIKN